MHVADLVGFQTLNAPRLLSVVAGAVTTVAVYHSGRLLMDRGRALLAGALTATSGVLLWTTGPLTGDGPAAAFATSAVAVALSYRRAPSTRKAIAITLLAGAAVSVKSLLVGPALLIAWLLVITSKRIVHALLVPLGATLMVVVLAAPWGFSHVFDQYVRYHLDKTANRKPLENLNKLVTTFFSRDLWLVTLAVLAAVTALVRREPSTRAPSDARGLGRLLDGTRVLWWWAGIALATLLLQDPMFRNHLTAFVAPACLLVARYRPSWRAVAIAAVITLPIQAYHLRPLLWPQDFHGAAATEVARLRALPDGAWALSDEPGLVWRAGHGTDPFFVDPSVLRIDSRVGPIKVTEDRIVRAARQPRMCAVVATAPVRFARFPTLPARLEAAGYERVQTGPNGRGVWVRRRCDPPGRAQGFSPASPASATAAPARSPR